MIPTTLLKLTDYKALGFAIYGGPGLDKTKGVATLPPKTLLLDFEGGTTSLMPWIHRTRSWDEASWHEYSQADREAVFQPERSFIKPAPYIDIIHFDPTIVECYDAVVTTVTQFKPETYSSLALDSLHEFSAETQTFTKGKGNELLPMSGNWSGAQERAAILLRKMRAFRDSGVFIYLTSSEQVDKDYVTDPRSAKKGETPQEPYSVKGTLNVPGKLVSAVQHAVDVMGHARSMNGSTKWVFKPEPLPGGSAQWEAKDRTGRIKTEYCTPNIRQIMKEIYGEEVARQIYGAGKSDSEAGVAA